MARKTKAQREAEHQAEAEQRLKDEVAHYEANLMPLLERACKVGFELSVVASHSNELVFNLHHNRSGTFHLSPKYHSRWVSEMNDVEFFVESFEEQTREEKRREQVRKNALEKLTEEERKELLGY